MLQRSAQLIQRLRERQGLRRAAGAFSIQIAEKGFRFGVNLFIQALIARHLGPESYGILGFITKTVGIFATLPIFGFDDFYVRDQVTTTSPRVRQFRLLNLLAMRMSLAVLAYIFLVIYVFCYPQSGSTSVILLLSYGLIYFLYPLNVFETAFISELRFKLIGTVRVVSFSLISLWRAFGALFQPTVLFFVLSNLLEYVMLTGYFGIRYVREQRRLRFRWMTPFLRRSLLAGLPMFMVTFVTTMSQRISYSLLDSAGLTKELGFFTLCQNLIEASQVLPVSFATSVFPALVVLHASDRPTYEKRRQHFFDVLIWFAIAGWLGALLFGEPFLRIVFGSQYRGLGPLLAVTCLSNLIVFFQIAAMRALLIEGKLLHLISASVAGIVLSTVLQARWIPGGGAIGATEGWMAGQLIAYLILVPFSRPTREVVVLGAKALLAPYRLLRAS